MNSGYPEKIVASISSASLASMISATQNSEARKKNHISKQHVIENSNRNNHYNNKAVMNDGTTKHKGRKDNDVTSKSGKRDDEESDVKESSNSYVESTTSSSKRMI